MGLFDFFKKAAGASPSKKDQPKKENLIGEVEGYFRKAGAAVIKVKKGPIRLKDEIWIFGHTTDLKFVIDQMQIDRKDIAEADKGKSIGVKVKKRCRAGDKVYRVPPAV